MTADTDTLLSLVEDAGYPEVASFARMMQERAAVLESERDKAREECGYEKAMRGHIRGELDSWITRCTKAEAERNELREAASQSPGTLTVDGRSFPIVGLELRAGQMFVSARLVGPQDGRDAGLAEMGLLGVDGSTIVVLDQDVPAWWAVPAPDTITVVLPIRLRSEHKP